MTKYLAVALTSLFLGIVIFSTQPSQADPQDLLSCDFGDGLPIRGLSVTKVDDILWLFEKPPYAPWKMRKLSAEEWTKKRFALSAEIEGVPDLISELYFEKGSWMFSFKDTHGWYMRGSPYCN